jgi:phosphoglycolate phosphatase
MMALRRAAVISGGSVAPDQAFVVGDTPHDVAAAHAAGVPCVGVASHHYSADELRAGGADWVLDSLADGLPL